MELCYIFIIISVLTSASSMAFTIMSPEITKEVPKSIARVKRDMDKVHTSVDYTNDYVPLPAYSIYIIGFSMFFMLIAIAVLAVALYLALKNKSIFGFNNASNKQYVRQESTGVTPLYNSNYDEQNKNNGSTLTVNSGIIEISEPRASDPITPTQLENSKIVFAKKPLRPIVPVMHKGQMDAICKEVLRKVQKSDSASFRDLNELLKFEKKEDNFGMKSEDVKESEKENKTEEKADFQVESQMFKLKKPEIKNDTQMEIKTEAPTENKTHEGKEINEETKEETKNETTNKTKSETKPDESEVIRIEVDKVESDKNEDASDSETEYDTVPSPIRFRHSGPEPDQTMYDTVPNPMQYRHSGPERDHLDQSVYDTVVGTKRFRYSGAETDDDIDDIPLYDLPPTRGSQDSPLRNVIQMDPGSHYLIPISSEKTDSCYVNAKTQSFKSP